MKTSEITELLGKVLSKVENLDNERIVFTVSPDEKYVLYHIQDCCESVRVEDINGELEDLVGSPILIAEEVTSREDPPGFQKQYQDESFTWTFYKFATAKGYVTIRWYGASNGYYSESVSFSSI